MSSVLYFSPAFKHGVSPVNPPPSSRKSSKKRKRGVELPKGNDEESEANSAANGTSLPSGYSNAPITTSSAALNVDISHGDDGLHSQTPTYTDQEGLPTSIFPRSFPHHTAKTARSMSQGRISDELASLKPSLYVATGRIPTATTGKTPKSTGLRQHHLNTTTAILHRCLLTGDYNRAGRAWAMLLRAEQNGHSMDLRTHDRWGVGAEVLMQRELQLTQRTLNYNVVEIPILKSNVKVKAESMEKAREYYESVILQYSYRKAFPNATGPLSFSLAMFSLWIYAVKERSSTALVAVGGCDTDIDGTDAEAEEVGQRSSTTDMDPDRYRKREQVKRDTLESAHEIATHLNELLVSPPYFDNARFWKLCGEIALWIADLSVSTINSDYSSSISGDDENQVAERSSIRRTSPPNDQHGAGQERQKALAKAKEAFQRAKICGQISVE